MKALEFYRKHDLFSDPGESASRYMELPTKMNALHGAINELLIHNWKVERDRPGWIKAHPQEVDVFTRPIHIIPCERSTKDCDTQRLKRRRIHQLEH